MSVAAVRGDVVHLVACHKRPMYAVRVRAEWVSSEPCCAGTLPAGIVAALGAACPLSGRGTNYLGEHGHQAAALRGLTQTNRRPLRSIVCFRSRRDPGVGFFVTQGWVTA